MSNISSVHHPHHSSSTFPLPARTLPVVPRQNRTDRWPAHHTDCPRVNAATTMWCGSQGQFMHVNVESMFACLELIDRKTIVQVGVCPPLRWQQRADQSRRAWASAYFVHARGRLRALSSCSRARTSAWRYIARSLCLDHFGSGHTTTQGEASACMHGRGGGTVHARDVHNSGGQTSGHMRSHVANVTRSYMSRCKAVR